MASANLNLVHVLHAYPRGSRCDVVRARANQPVSLAQLVFPTRRVPYAAPLGSELASSAFCGTRLVMCILKPKHVVVFLLISFFLFRRKEKNRRQTQGP